jgi:predicted hydrocarbon binding protein
MNKLYLKEPKNGHNDLTCPLKIVHQAKTHSGYYEYIVYSSIVDKTFSVTEEEVKLTPVDSEYVIDTPMKSEVATRILTHMEKEKRFKTACMAMQGFITAFYSSPETFSSLRALSIKKDLAVREAVAKLSYEFADMLIKEENEELDNKV